MSSPQEFSSITSGEATAERPWHSKRKAKSNRANLMDPHALRDRANVMEMLVAEEVERQLRRCPSTLLDYVKAVEVETYALNRLPPLYAASHEGLEYQKQRARREYGPKIQTAVRQAFSAIQRDPLRKSTPLVSEDDRTRHQMIIEMAAKFATQENMSSEPPETPEESISHDKAARFRRSSPSHRPSHRRSKVSAVDSRGRDGWDSDQLFNH